MNTVRLTWVRTALILLLLVVGVVAGARPQPAAAAAPRLTLSQTVVAAGGHVTVRGSNFQPGDTATAMIIPASAASGSKRVTAATAKVDHGGVASVTVTVPQGTAPGFYAVLMQDTHNNLAVEPFQVLMGIQLKSGKAGPHVFPVPGLHLSVSGTGFKSGEAVVLQAAFPLFAGGTQKVTAKATADKNGAFGPTDMQVPWQARDAKVPLQATGQKSGKSGAVTATLSVAHHPYLLPVAQTVAGGPVLVRGGGFVPGTKVTVSVPVAHTATSTTTLEKTVSADGQGAVSVSFTLPHKVQPGTYTITATSQAPALRALSRVTVAGSSPTPGTTPSATATATPAPVHTSITVAPLSVIPGADAQVIGKGFVPGTKVTISASVKGTNGATGTVQATATTDKKGSFTATLHTPGDASGGKYQVTAKGAQKRSARGTLVIAVLKPSVVAVPALAVPGTAITVNGFGFSSGGQLAIWLAGQKIGTGTANGSGAFKVSLKVPGNLATGYYTLSAVESSGRRASIGMRIYRQISTHFYFASLYTGSGFHEYLLFVNTTPIRTRVYITYQLSSGAPRSRSIIVPAHQRVTEDVNRDLGNGVNASAVIATDVPISAERMVIHGTEGSLDPGTTTPSTVWYFANGNTSHHYQEYIAVQNPTKNPVQVTLQVQPTHSHTFYLHRTMGPESRTTWFLNKNVNDAIGVIVTANGPVVANRTIFIHQGISSKTGVRGPQTHWYFASGPTQSGTRNWIGVINSTSRPSYMTMHVYDPQGAEVTTIKRWLKPYDRQGYLMNRFAGQTDVAVAISTTQPSIAEQSSFVAGSHAADTDCFGVTSPQKTAQFAEATTWPHQDNQLTLFNPNVVAIPVVVQFLNARGNTEEHTYIVPPFAHQMVDVGSVMPNSQLGLLAASSDPFVALDRQMINDGAGAMTSLGTQS